jgi:glycosyltransferase involved in cell wall biosynthesis
MRKRNCYLIAKNCAKILSRNAIDFDLVHAHFLENGFVGAVCKSLRGTPLIVTAHGGDVYNLPFRDSWYYNLARYVLSEADKVITVSHFLAEKLSALSVSSKKLHVIPNGYDENLFKPLPSNAMRKKLGLPLNKRILLSVGNLVDVKGHRYLIDAMSMVLKKRSDILLVIVGDGSLKTSLEKKIREFGIENRVLLTGRKRHAEVSLWMNACDVFVLPSLNESFGVVIIEALACGKPVVATCVGGVSEIIANEDVGILVKPAHPLSLYRGILDALNRKWTPTNIALYARRYSWANIIPSILRVYDEALNSSSD